MRVAFYKTMTDATAVMTIVDADSWYESGAIVDTPEPPFVVVRWGPETVHGGPSMTSRTVQVWAHQARGSYDTINNVLHEVMEVAAGMSEVEVPWAQGISRVTQADYVFGSGELFDREYKTNCRYVEFRCTGRER